MKHNLVPVTDIDTRQAAGDQVLEAPDLLASLIFNQQTAGIHPWHASDHEQLQAGLAATAFYLDVTAEALRRSAVIHRGQEMVTADVAKFGAALTDRAAISLRFAQQMHSGQQSVNGIRQSFENLYPENQLTYWPLGSMDVGTPDWQSAVPPIASGGLIKAVAVAGTKIYVHTFGAVRRNLEDMIADVPAEYDGVPSQIEDMATPANEQLEAISTYLDEDLRDEGFRLNAYVETHDAYLVMMHAFVAAHAPQVLGPDFIPQDR